MKKTVLFVALILLLSFGTSCADGGASVATFDPTYVATQTEIDEFDNLVAISSHVFTGTYLRNGEAEGISSFTHDVFSVDSMLKALSAWPDDEFPVISGEHNGLNLVVGESYLVFATLTDLAVYPIPLVSSEAIFPLTEAGAVKEEIGKQLIEFIPILKDASFRADPAAAVSGSPEIETVSPYYVSSPADGFDDTGAMVAASDVVIRTTLISVNQGVDAVHLCAIDQDNLIVLKNEESLTLRDTVAVPFRPDPIEEYLVFLRLVGPVEDNAFDLVARTGAVIPRSDTAAWDAALTAAGGSD